MHLQQKLLKNLRGGLRGDMRGWWLKPRLRHPLNEEVESQFKIATKRSLNSALYQKISILFRKISNYGASSKFQGIHFYI